MHLSLSPHVSQNTELDWSLTLVRGNDTHHSDAVIHEDSCPVSLVFKPFTCIFSLMKPVTTTTLLNTACSILSWGLVNCLRCNVSSFLPFLFLYHFSVSLCCLGHSPGSTDTGAGSGRPWPGHPIAPRLVTFLRPVQPWVQAPKLVCSVLSGPGEAQAGLPGHPTCGHWTEMMVSSAPLLSRNYNVKWSPHHPRPDLCTQHTPRHRFQMRQWCMPWAREMKCF